MAAPKGNCHNRGQGKAHLRGQNHPSAKIDDQDVRNMREMYALRQYHLQEAAKLTIDKIAEKYELCYTHTRNIVLKRTWIHVI